MNDAISAQNATNDRLIAAEAVITPDGLQGDAILVGDGRIRAIGCTEELDRPGLLQQRFPGGVIIPGLVDAHFHPLGYTAALMRLTLDGAVSMSDLQRLIRAAAGELQPDQALIGTRLDDHSIGRFPTRNDLDAAAGDRPVLLYRYCGHVAIANTAALKLAEIDEKTPNPSGGTIDRDEFGIPTGILRETAIALAAGPVGGRTGDLTPNEVLTAMTGLASLGLTSLGAIIDLSGDLWCGVGNELDLLTEIGPDLPLRMPVLVITDDPSALEASAVRLDGAGSRVRFLGVKQFADGSFGGHTAAMYQPFTDRDTTGTLRIGPTTERMARTALGMGGQVAIHAIGDRATGQVLDMFEVLIEDGANPTDLRIEHASVITGSDLARMAELEVTAVVQPAFLMSEKDWLMDRVGVERLEQTYAFKSMLEAGIPLAGSSDCPVEPPSPWWGMAAARDRGGLTPSQQLNASEAFALFTSGAATAIGSPLLEVGAPCDISIIDRDPLISSPDELRGTKALGTWIDGVSTPLPTEPVVWTT